MAASDAKSLPSIGFLTIRDYEELGLIGGYLILNVNGRPLEFHCTAPVRPNRAQQILYGPTLEPFLFGEQIGQALVSKGKSKPMFICTDVEPALALREQVSQPVVFLRSLPPTEGAITRVDSAHQVPQPHLAGQELDGHYAASSNSSPNDLQRALEHWAPYAGSFDLMEPFSRLSEAIDETQSGVVR